MAEAVAARTTCAPRDHRVAVLLIRARDAFVAGDPTMVRRWFRLAEITVAMEAERSTKEDRD